MQTRYVETGWGILFGENKNFILRCFTTTRYRTDSARKQNGNELIGKKKTRADKDLKLKLIKMLKVHLYTKNGVDLQIA